MFRKKLIAALARLLGVRVLIERYPTGWAYALVPEWRAGKGEATTVGYGFEIAAQPLGPEDPFNAAARGELKRQAETMAALRDDAVVSLFVRSEAVAATRKHARELAKRSLCDAHGCREEVLAALRQLRETRPEVFRSSPETGSSSPAR